MESERELYCYSVHSDDFAFFRVTDEPLTRVWAPKGAKIISLCFYHFQVDGEGKVEVPTGLISKWDKSEILVDGVVYPREG